MKTKMGVLIIGTGWVSGEHIKAYQANPHTEVRGLSNIHPEKAEAVRRRFGLDCPVSADYRALLQSVDIDIVSVCTIHSAHYDEAVASLEAGKHVMVEKPLCMTFEQAVHLRDLATKSGRRTAVGFVARWYPAIRSLKNMVDAGMIGDPYYIESDYWHEVAPGWKSTAETAGSALLTGGVHAVDMMRYFQKPGTRATEVFAYSYPPGRRPDFTYDPTIALMVRFADGTVGRVGCCLQASMPYVFHLQVLGSRGAIRGPRIYSESLMTKQAFMEVPGVYPDSADVGHHPFDQEIDHFVDCIVNEREPMISIPDAFESHEIVFAAERSARDGMPVSLPLASE
jgi:predicted dehydrogenase